MDVEDVKKQIAELQSQVDASKKQTTEERLANIEKELNAMKDRYIRLLEHTIESNGNRKSETLSQNDDGAKMLVYPQLAPGNRSLATKIACVEKPVRAFCQRGKRL